jgi:exodeoxyribonuclease VII large subunit
MGIGLQRTLRDNSLKLKTISSALKPGLIRDRVAFAKQKHNKYHDNLLYIILKLINQKKWESQVAESRLMALNPMAVLERGYSITRTWPQRTIIKNARQIQINDPVEITLASGTLFGRIEGKDDDGI